MNMDIASDISRFKAKRQQQIGRVQEVITRVYSKYLPKQEEILAQKNPGWEQEFKTLRMTAMEELRQELPPVLKECPDLLMPEDWEPRIPRTFKPRDFRSTLIIRDPVSHVYLIALILDPQQGTSPHDHNSPCFEYIYKGHSLEYTFDGHLNETGIEQHENGSTTSINGYGFRDANLHTVYNPAKLDFKKERPSRDKMTVQLHLYEGYNFAELDKGNLQSLMGPEVKLPANTHASYAIPGHLARSTNDWHMPPEAAPALKKALERTQGKDRG